MNDMLNKEIADGNSTLAQVIGLVPSDNKPLLEPMLTQIYGTFVPKHKPFFEIVVQEIVRASKTRGYRNNSPNNGRQVTHPNLLSLQTGSSTRV